MQFAWGYAPTLVLESALQFRVFDLLDGAPKSLPALSAASGASMRGLKAILNALVGLNFLARKGARYSLTPESAAFFVSTKPDYRGKLFHHTVRQLMPRWMQLAQTVRTGRPAFAVDQEEAGSNFFFEFVESLFPLNHPSAKALAAHLDLRKLASPATVLDIGAGSGVWGIGLAQESLHIRIRAVDWPGVLKVTRKIARRHGLADRLTCSPGDLLKADFGHGHKVATIGHILHSEGSKRSQQLLRRTYDALAPGGTVAIAEWIPNDERTGPPSALLFAVNMLVHTHDGDTFTFAEISQWLRAAGFRNPRLLEVPAPCPLVLATK